MLIYPPYFSGLSTLRAKPVVVKPAGLKRMIINVSFMGGAEEQLPGMITGTSSRAKPKQEKEGNGGI